jgi:hypothetical protein
MEEQAKYKTDDGSKQLAVIEGSLFLSVARFEFGQRVAKMLAESTMVPEHFRGNVGNCMIAMNMAERWQADVFMVMQNVYLIGKKPGIEAKLAIALINESGKFSPLQFKLEGQGDTRQCTAYATHNKTGERLEQVVTMRIAHAEGWVNKPGSKWKTMPDLMLQYRSATFFARMYCPEVLLGMQTRDEIYDYVDLEKSDSGSYEAQTTAADLEKKLKDAAKAQPTELSENTKRIVEEEREAIRNVITAESEKPNTMGSDPLHPDNWKNFRAGKPEAGTGYAVFVFQHQAEIRDADADTIAAMRGKWVKLYPDQPWFLDDAKGEFNEAGEPVFDETESRKIDEAQARLEKKRDELRQGAKEIPEGREIANGQVIGDNGNKGASDLRRALLTHPNKHLLAAAKGNKNINAPIAELTAKECQVLIDEINELAELEERY